MKAKKILSLILAIAMMATISVSAAQSEVYIYEDFDYDSMDDFYKAYGWLDANGEQTEYYANTTRDQVFNQAFFTALKESGNDKMFMHDHKNYQAFRGQGKAYWSLAANSNGDNAYYNVAKANTGAWSEKLTFAAPKAWNGIENADEAYVISYDQEVVAHRFEGDTFTGTYTAKLDANGKKVYTTSPNLSSHYVDYSPVCAYYENMGTGSFSYVSLNNYNYVFNTTYTPDPDAELAEGVVEAGTYECTVKSFDVQDGWNGAYGNHFYFPVGDGVHTFTSVITKKSDTSLQRRMYHDGVPYNNNKATDANLKANYTIHGVGFNFGSWVSEKRTNLKAYTLKTGEGAFNVSAVEDVIPAYSTSVKVKFSQPVEASTYDETAVTMTAGGEALTYGEDFVVSDVTEVIESAGGEIYSEATVSFMTDLSEGTNYVITFPGTIKNTMYTDLEGYNVASFSTPKPEIAINAFNAIKGFGSADEAVVEGFVADESLQGAKINLTNTTDAAKNVAIIYAVYASNGQLNNIVYINDSIDADSTAAFHAGVKLSETGKVKAFIWDGLTSVKPYRDATVKTIAAAE